MQTNAFRKRDYTFTAELWGYIEASGGDSAAVRTYFHKRTVNLLAVTAAGTAGKMTFYFLDEDNDIRQFDQLFNLFGPDGVELHPHGVWMIDFAGPNINIWGRREGLKARATLFAVNG